MRTLAVLAICTGLAMGAIALRTSASGRAAAQPGGTATLEPSATTGPTLQTPVQSVTPGRSETPPGSGTPELTQTPTQPSSTPLTQQTPAQSVTPGPTASTSEPLETPVVDPEPAPGRVFLPRVIRGEDAALPPPIVPVEHGWLASLTERGREACAPATHVLLEKREGALHNRTVAVLDDLLVDLSLDLFIGEFVEVNGTESMSPEACRSLTSRLIGVTWIRRVPRPPGVERGQTRTTPMKYQSLATRH